MKYFNIQISVADVVRLAVCPALSLPGVCPVKTREVGVECLVFPALILVLLIFAKLYRTVRIFRVGGGGGEGGAVSQPGCVCHSTLCCCCPLQSARPTVGISFGKNTSIFSLNCAWILMFNWTTRHLIIHTWFMSPGTWKGIKYSLIKNVFMIEVRELHFN